MRDYLCRFPATMNGLTPWAAANRFAAECWQEPREIREMHAVGDKCLWQFSLVGGSEYQCRFFNGYLVIEEVSQ